MAEKVTVMVLKVDLQCSKCYKKVKKILCKFPQIRDQIFDEKSNAVTITVVCCSPEKIRDKLCCKGRGSIKSIDIIEPKKPDPAKPPPVVEKPKPKPDPPVVVAPPPEKPKEKPTVVVVPPPAKPPSPKPAPPPKADPPPPKADPPPPKADPPPPKADPPPPKADPPPPKADPPPPKADPPNPVVVVAPPTDKSKEKTGGVVAPAQPPTIGYPLQGCPQYPAYYYLPYNEGPCHQQPQPPPCHCGYGGRSGHDAYGGGYCSNRCDYFSEENPSSCSVM